MAMLGMGYVLLGGCIGSFLNLCIDRLPRGSSIISPPSRCDSCGHRLAAWDLIPVLSFLWLRGRCRYCTARFALRNPLIELSTAALFGLIWLRFPESITAIFMGLYGALLILILAIDLEQHRILNRVIYPAIAVAILAAPLTPGANPWSLLLGGVAGLGILLLIALLFPSGMGFGDVKLGAFIGLAVGFPGILLALFLSFTLGGLISGLLLLAHLIRRRDSIAFAPFLAAGAIISLLYGEQILRWWAGGI